MRRRRSPGNPRDRPGLTSKRPIKGCVSKRECTLTKCRMNVSTLGVSSQKKTDPVEVTQGPDPGDKAEAWKGVRTLGGCSRHQARDDELGRAPVPPCTTRAPKKERQRGQPPSSWAPICLGPDSVYQGPPQVKKEKLSEGQHGPPKNSRGNPSNQ